ncbi:MAG: hypothetical protein EBU33_08405 [Sphingobacteriia bacterium]|nr:hypothetical protein [Sphingobacteriia bacterium]
MNIIYVNHGTYIYEIIVVVIFMLIKWCTTNLGENQQRANIQLDIPQHVVQRLITYAVQNKECCPITLNPVVAETSSITSCFHVFDTEAIQQCLRRNNMCPVCRYPGPALITYMA